MPMNRYQIRNVYSLADPEVYKAADKDDPEALLEGVAMAGLVGVLRQLGDLAEFAAEIFRDLHEEVLATASRGHGLLERVQQLESEIPPIERAFLSQTSHSAFFTNSGVDWHPNRQETQNLITTGDLPRFVMDSYEEFRGPPRLFLLDKFDVGGAGACLKRYTDPSIFKAEASSYEIETAETPREKKTRQMKKKGSKGKGGDTPEVSQPSHAKLHQLFLEERVQTGATEAARRVKLKTRPKKIPFDSESGECYMNKLLNSPSCAHEAALTPSNELRLEDGGITRSALGSPMKKTSPCVSPKKEAESRPSYADVEVDDNQITVDDEIHTVGLQKGYPSEDVASETDNYVDALANMEAEVETCTTQGTYSANKHQLQSQLSIENSTVSNDGSNSTTKEITLFGNSDTRSSLTKSTSPVGADSPPQPFASIEIPFHPRVPLVDETCIDTSKVSNVDQVACLEEGSDLKKDAAECTSEHSDVLSMGVKQNIYGDLENKYLSDTTFNDDVRVPEEQLKEKEDGVLVISDQAEARVLYSNGSERESDNSEIEPANTNESTDISVIKEGTGTESEEREIESNYSDVHRDDGKGLGDDTKLERIEADSVNFDRETSAVALLPVDVDKHEDERHSLSEQDSGEKKEVDELMVISRDQKHTVLPDLGSQPVSIGPCVSNVQIIDSAHEAAAFTESDILEAADSSPLKDKVDQSSNQPHIQLPLETEGSLTQVDHETDVDTHLQDLQSFSESYSVIVSAEPPTMELRGHDIISDQDDSITLCHHELIVLTEADQDLESKSVNHGDNVEAPVQSSPLEDKVDQPIGQLYTQIKDLQSSPESYSVPVSENPPTMELNNNLFDQVNKQSSPVLPGFGMLPQSAPVKPEDAPPLPPLPPMQWRMRKLQGSLSTPTNGGHSTIDETINLDTENQEVFWPSSSPYPLPLVLDEMQTNIRPMKVQRPRSPLIDAVAAHDKTKERDTLLDQIRAKSINLKPAVQARPIIQGPNTNLRVAAILEKANAIRQAFAGSDDDDDSDNWSDS